VFLVLGIIATFVTLLVERKPVFFYLALNGFLAVGFLVFSGFVIFSQSVQNAMSPWELLAVSFLAAGAMATYLLATHKLLRRELHDVDA
jgi:divalent metal cation (Fe/Co/Zn/Cd) transporter